MTISLRVIGLGVAAIVLMAASQLLMLSFETDPLLAQNTIDRATLEDAIERRLEIIDRRNDIAVRINRRGRVNARLVTPDPSMSGPVQEMRDTIDAQCESRSLPCRSGRITSTVPRLLTSRRQVR